MKCINSYLIFLLGLIGVNPIITYANAITHSIVNSKIVQPALTLKHFLTFWSPNLRLNTMLNFSVIEAIPHLGVTVNVDSRIIINYLNVEAT